MKILKSVFIIFLILYIFFRLGIYFPVYWQKLAPGLEYTLIIPPYGFPLGKIHAFRIDLRNYHFDIEFTKNNKGKFTSIRNLAIKNNAVVVINGGFFSTSLKPLGLRLKNGIAISPIKKTSWWNIFFIKNNKAYIVKNSDFYLNKNISFAIQSGPRLIVNGKIASLKPGIAERSALGITSTGRVILVVTENLLLKTKDLATLMRDPISKGGLDCIDALNLDGGHSSQVYSHINSFLVNSSGVSPISDAILVVPYKKNREK